ncbi:MAG: hypothetical protein V2A77_04515 [Pseudomonadota bacterium]
MNVLKPLWLISVGIFVDYRGEGIPYWAWLAYEYAVVPGPVLGIMGGHVAFCRWYFGKSPIKNPTLRRILHFASGLLLGTISGGLLALVCGIAITFGILRPMPLEVVDCVWSGMRFVIVVPALVGGAILGVRWANKLYLRSLKREQEASHQETGE